MARVLRLWWVQVLLVYLASRVVSTAILLWFAHHQGVDFWAFASQWDGQWYWTVAVHGYPAELPLTEDGHVYQNAWAFMPAYPLVVWALSLGGVLPWPQVAVLVSVLCGGGAALVMHRLWSTWLPPRAAIGAVALFCFVPVSPLFQLAYAEAMYALLLAICLLALVRRRYWTMLPFVALMALTRPSGLAFALAMAGHVVYRFAVRRRDPFPVGERVAAIAVGAVSGLAGLAWPVIAAVATGSLTAYTDTELFWRAGYIGFRELIPFAPWFEGAVWWSEWVGAPPWLGVAVVVAGIALAAAALCSPWMRRLGVDLRIWVGAWLVYLLAVFFPQSSTWRLLFPAFPALGALAVPRSRWFVPTLVVAFVVAQWFWVDGMWAISGADWSPP